MKIRKLVSRFVPDRVKALRHEGQMKELLEGDAEAMALCMHEGAIFFANPRNKIERSLLRGKYDQTNSLLIRNLVKPGNVCFDIGANIGVYSVMLCHAAGPTGHVHAFEPVSHIRLKLRRNVNLNGFDWVTVNDVGLGDVESELPMNQVKEGTFRAGTSSFVKNPTIQQMGDESFDVVPVSITTLDSYVERAGISRFDFAKIDVEGFEINVLRGGRQTLARHRPKIIIEYDVGRHGSQHAEFRDLFEAIGYDVYECIPFGTRVVLKPFRFKSQPRERNLLCLPRP